MRVVRFWSIVVLAIVVLLFAQTVAFAETDPTDEKYFFDDHYKIDKDKGFSLDEEEKIKTKDPHYGWRLGSLYVSGYTQRTMDEDGDPVFLKNAGDQVKLGFKLEQDINKLNGNEDLTIALDKKAFDADFEIPKTNFKRGALIIQHTDYQNKTGKPVLYTDYLSADAKVNANTLVEVNEEGDYEVALDYVIKNAPRTIFGKDIAPSYSDYTIKMFKFSVRNGNSMVFPFDIKTGEELVNKSFTENGFRIDLAKSHYLKVFVKRDSVNGADTEDTRENKPAKDGAEFTEEGIYTITVEDTSTGQATIKKIYVGKEDRYKAYVTMGLSLDEIDKQLAEGASVDANGELIPASTREPQEPQEESAPSDTSASEQSKSGFPIALIVIVLIIVIVIILAMKRRHKRRLKSDSDSEDESI